MLLGLICLAVVFLARFFCRWNVEGLRLHREMPAQVFAGESFGATVFVRRILRSKYLIRDGYDLQIRDKLLQTSSVFHAVARLNGRTGNAVELKARLPRRGLHRRARYEIKSRWPFGLYEYKIAGHYEPRPNGAADEIIVFPRPFLSSVLLHQLEQFRAETIAKNSIEHDDAGDFRGIRPYRPGDPVKSIHWAATARSGELLARDWDPPRPRPQRFGIVLHSFTKTGQLVQPDRFEKALRIAAGLLLFCRKNRIPVWLCQDVYDKGKLAIPEQAGFSRGLVELALVSPTGLSKPKRLIKKIRELEACERLFVISDSSVDIWRRHIEGEHPHLVLADPESVSLSHSRPRIRMVPARAEKPT